MLSFVAKIQEYVADKSKVTLVFSKTKKMFPEGTLWLYANLDRFINGYKADIRCHDVRDDIVRQVLNHLGFFGLLRQKDDKEVSHETVIHWNKATGTKVQGEKVESFVTINNKEIQSLFIALSEAMANCVHHAHAKDDPTRRWWAVTQSIDDNLFVCFCDLGMGIPESIRSNRQKRKKILRILSSFLKGDMKKTLEGINDIGTLYTKDGALIKAAFEIKKSRTGDIHRGKGLNELRSVLHDFRGGYLRVHSGFGYYEYSVTKENGEIQSQEYENSESVFVQGTVITWSFKNQ
jgi:anti-sigma regulatory factor (Ser/Thr protein kinase)